MNGSHVEFIVAAYAVTAVAILAMVVSIVIDHRALKKALARFPQRDETP
jgi:heme exporter protein CcmD